MADGDFTERVRVKALTSLAAALKEVKPHILDGRSLRVGREFKSVGLRPRELLGNWLLCVVGCDIRGHEALAIAQDPRGGDGLIVDRATREPLFVEQVYIRPQSSGDIEELAVAALQHKVRKGAAYAAGRMLLIFSEATGSWRPNSLARRIAGRHAFDSVWFAHLDAGALEEGRYAYSVSELDVSDGDAPVWRVSISDDFVSWSVSGLP